MPGVSAIVFAAKNLDKSEIKGKKDYQFAGFF